MVAGLLVGDYYEAIAIAQRHADIAGRAIPVYEQTACGAILRYEAHPAERVLVFDSDPL